MWVKICATTNLEDARAAIDAGADALGFLFAPSSRRVSPRDAAKITGALPTNVEKIGVFLNQSAEIVLDTVDKAGLTGVQLHGTESVDYARHLLKKAGNRSLQITKTLQMTTVDATMTYAAELAEGTEVFTRILFDSGTPGKGGGTGKTFAWQDAAPIVRFISRKFDVVIAGGLTPQNVTKAIETFHPWGVDVASGVEREPGRKDHDKIRAFVATAKNLLVR